MFKECLSLELMKQEADKINLKKHVPIKTNTPMHVDLAPQRDEVYSGICLKSNDEVFIFICFNEDSKEFDGFAIIRNQDIEKYRYWDEDELNEVKNNNYQNYIGKLPLEKMNTFEQCLFELKNYKLIALFDESDDDSYFVGQIKDVSKKEVELQLLDRDSNWINNKKFVINKITYIGFETSYEKELLKMVKE